MTLHDPFEDARDVEGGVGVAPSPAIFDFLQQLLGAQPGGALANDPSASIGIGRPPAVPTGIQSGIPAVGGIPPGLGAPPDGGTQAPIPEVESSPLGPPPVAQSLDSGTPNLGTGTGPSPLDTAGPGLIGGEGLDIPPQQGPNPETDAILQAIMGFLFPTESGDPAAIQAQRQRPFG